MNDAPVARQFLSRLFNAGLVAGILGIAVAVVSIFVDHDSFFRGWLFGFAFWLGVSMGCIAILMFHYLMGGGWGVSTRRIFEAGGMTLPLPALAIIPVLVGLPSVYLWARPDVVINDPVLLHKAGYLNPGFFTIRSVLYLILWAFFGWCFFRWSAEQDTTDSPQPTRRMVVLSGPGLLILILTGSLAWMDWTMSLEPHWYSSVYPLMVLTGLTTASMALGILIATGLAADAEIQPALNRDRFHDLGTLLFTFVFFWGYLNYAQLIVIWAGNLKKEITWYLSRIVDGWMWMALALFVLAFLLPFFLLLFRTLKRARARLAAVALLVFFMQIVQLYWLIAPPFQSSGVEFHLSYPASLLGIGGLWLALFARLMQSRPLLPLRVPEFPSVVPPPHPRPAHSALPAKPIHAEGE